jgi:hypothetical protein
VGTRGLQKGLVNAEGVEEGMRKERVVYRYEVISWIYYYHGLKAVFDVSCVLKKKHRLFLLFPYCSARL